MPSPRVTSFSVPHRSRSRCTPRALTLALLAIALPLTARPATPQQAVALGVTGRPYALVQALHHCNAAHYCTSGGPAPVHDPSRAHPNVSAATPRRGKATSARPTATPRHAVIMPTARPTATPQHTAAPPTATPTSVPTATPTTAPSATPTTAPASITPSQAELLGLINAERAQAGAAPLAFDPTLNAIAQWRSQDMIARHYFSHQIPGLPGISLVFDVLDRDHVPYEMAGENIALNNYINYYPLAQTVQQTNTDFMNSPDHRANILEPKYSKVGLGLAFEQGTGKLIVTEIFVQP